MKAKDAAPSSAIKVTQKRRFNFCPAPERYLKSREDDDDDHDEAFVSDTERNEGETQRLVGTSAAEQTTEQQQRHLKDGVVEEALNSSSQSVSDPPRRVRCHSKEFDVDSLDLIDGRRSSLEDIPLDRGESSSSLPPPPQPPQQQHQEAPPTSNQRGSDPSSTTDGTNRISQHFVLQPMDPGEPLLQESPEEYHVKPKAKLMPLKAIRPTSKCSCSCCVDSDARVIVGRSTRRSTARIEWTED